MATRLASVLKKKTVMETKISPDGIKENQAVSRKAKKVTFRPESENEVFEFTRSVKKPRRTNVRSRSQEGPAQDIQLGGNIELRRSQRIVANGIITVSTGLLKTKKGCSLLDVTKAQNVPRRSKGIGFSARSVQEESKESALVALEQFEANKKDISRGLSGNNIQVRRRSTRLAAKSCMGSGTSEAGILLPTERSKLLVVDTSNKEDHEFVKNNTNELFMESEVQEARRHYRKDEQVDPKAEKVLRRSRRRFMNEMTNTQDQRRSLRLKASAAISSIGGGRTSDGRDLCFAKESKEERNTVQSRRNYGSRYSQEGGEPVKNITKEPLVDCDVQTTEKQRKMKVQNVSIDKKVPRRSKRRRC